MAATDFTLTAQQNSTMQELGQQVNQLLLLLSQRERYIIEKRFGLDDLHKFTLEEIGQHFQLTRERVRQIEKNALKKLRRNIDNFGLTTINALGLRFLQESGGVLREDILLSKVLTEQQGLSAANILFVLNLSKDFSRAKNTLSHAPYFWLNTIESSLIDEVSSKAVSILKHERKVFTIDEMKKQLKDSIKSLSKLTNQALQNIFLAYKQFKVLDDKVGLIEWRDLHPRTLRDKIFFILRKSKKPLHFVDIANSIVQENFNKKNVNLQAVHNELIRHPDFILIGRGIYALKEWGYSEGTVADVITDILREKKELSEEEIVAEVLKQRQVKKITILLNLKNKPQFVRVGRKRYALKSK